MVVDGCQPTTVRTLDANGHSMLEKLREQETSMMLRILTAVVLLTATAGAVAAEDYAVYGSESYFKLDWEQAQRAGRTVVIGRFMNDSGATAKDIRLRVEGLDQTGRVVSTTTGYVAGQITPGTRTFFEVPVPPGASSYRVSVLSFDVLQSGKSKS